ncbi:MAG TPA: UDP-N-acetylglucosamine 1-carboxyvinyltransferase [Candidatus Anoxymicrobiaceae bacterium]
MDKYVIEGGGRLRGALKVSGAKNSVLKLMAASIMAEDTCRVSNVPDIADVHTMMEVLRYIGLGVEFSDGTMVITPAREPTLEAPYHLVQRMRASVEVLGPLVARYGQARVAMPGGCNLGARQIDMHMKGLEQMGAQLGVSHGYVEAEARTLSGCRISLDFASVGATENLLMASVLAEGKTVIENAAKEPEIRDLIQFLIEMGAKITGDGTSTLVIEGSSSLGGTDHAVIGDRIEAGTFLLGGAVTRGEVTVTGIDPGFLEIVVEKMRDAGCSLDVGDDTLSVWVPGDIRGLEVATLPYPGFPTDLQPQMLTLLATGSGTSFVTENIFENRFMVVDELNRLGADIKTHDHHAIVRGVPTLSGAPVTCADLRAGAALVLAGLVAEGVTEVYDIGHIDRGYEKFEEKLASLGATMSRVPEEA